MIFPNCERLGQTIIFVQRRETGRQLHNAVRFFCPLYLPFFCPLYLPHALFREAHGAMRSLMWHKNQKSVFAVILALVNEAQT